MSLYCVRKFHKQNAMQQKNDATQVPEVIKDIVGDTTTPNLSYQVQYIDQVSLNINFHNYENNKHFCDGRITIDHIIKIL
jgi:hypothetical protein